MNARENYTNDDAHEDAFWFSAIWASHQVDETEARASLLPAYNYAMEDVHAKPKYPAYWYMVETVSSGLRYAGRDFDEAVANLLALGDNEEGYAVAEIDGVYSSAESNRVENAAIKECPAPWETPAHYGEEDAPGTGVAERIPERPWGSASHYVDLS